MRWDGKESRQGVIHIHQKRFRVCASDFLDMGFDAKAKLASSPCRR